MSKEKVSKKEALEALRKTTKELGRRVKCTEMSELDMPSYAVYHNLFGGIKNAYKVLNGAKIEKVKKSKRRMHQKPTFEPQNLKEAFGIGVKV